MQYDKFERILAGESVNLDKPELEMFQGYCSARNLPLEQLIEASMTLYNIHPQFSYAFLIYIDKNELPKPIYNDIQHQGGKISIYNSLIGFILAKATRENSKDDSDKLMAQATKYLNASNRVKMIADKSTILSWALMEFYGGKINKAFDKVNNIMETIKKQGAMTDESRRVLVTATLVFAQIQFIKKNYQKALDSYKKCLELNRNLPTKARMGMAYSFFYLGKYEMARACFERIIKLDPTCVEAYIGIAVVCDKEDSFQQYFTNISKAYSINKRHPLVLLHLAEHFLFRKQLQKVNKFCQEGLKAIENYPKFTSIEDPCKNDYEELKARFNNLLGQTHHINSNYIEAIKYYTLASGKGLVYNQVQLAQCYINPNSVNYLESIRLLQLNYTLAQGKDGRMLNDSYRLMAYLKSKVPAKGKDDKGSEYYYIEAIRFNRNDFDSKIQYANILVDNNKIKALKLLEEAQKIQRNSGNEVKPELQNNIAVLYLENGENQTCQKKLESCIKAIDAIICENQQQQVRKQSLQIVTRFNYGICLQKQYHWHDAKGVYEEILKLNNTHIDTSMRLAYVWYQLGSYNKISQIFEEVDKLCTQNKKILKFERIANAKAYIQHISGSSSEARQTLKMLGKQKDVYTQIFDICITYEGIMRKGVELSVLKEFLRPNRQFCYKVCREDHYASFAYMLLAIILLADKKFTKSQGIQFFNNLKQFSSDQLPTLLYNMGFFLLNYDDYQTSNAIFQLYKDKVGSNTKTDELMALNYLLENNLSKAECYVKRNILRQPCNLKYKLQYSYILERRSHQYYQRGIFKKIQVEKRLEQLRFSMNTHHFFSKVSLSDSLKGIQCPELKERIKSIYLKVKSCGEERKFYIKSYMDSFDKVLRDLADEEAKKTEEEKISANHLINQQKQLQLQRMLEQAEEESEDQQEKQRKQLQKKRQRALQFARKRQAQMDNAWNQLKMKDMQLMEQKKSRKRGPRQDVKPSVGRKRYKRDKESSVEFEQEPDLLPQSEDDASFGGGESEPEQEKHEELEDEHRKKHKHDKKKKKDKHKHKHRRRSDEESGGEEERKSEKKSPEQENNDEELQKYMI